MGAVPYPDDGGAEPLTWSRMFAPAIGIAEDPVTGNGHGPLGAYPVRHGLAPLTDGGFAFTGRQGVAMGRPGEVEVLVRAGADGALTVSVTGDAVTAFRAELHL
ncbi:PhzF family phenazine biosynthesis protein [Embleya sp. AB8]|uniref:PhzF family phenazine biosynthesis protein n=1 Tax=Embleya sp. AB8 TaxID=3156304 RepID=UPI003C779AE6